MDLLAGLKRLLNHSDDEIFYAFVAMELENKDIRKGLWTKALAHADMNSERARSHYILLRVHQLQMTAPDLPSQLARISSLTDDLNTLSTQINALETEYKNRDSEIEHVTHMIASLRSAISALPDLRRLSVAKLALFGIAGASLGLLPDTQDAGHGPTATALLACIGAGASIALASLANYLNAPPEAVEARGKQRELHGEVSRLQSRLSLLNDQQRRARLELYPLTRDCTRITGALDQLRKRLAERTS
jgi:chromosome segregation ATPase